MVNMSIQIPSEATSQSEIRQQIETKLAPYEKSCQAHGDARLSRHNDGEQIHQAFGIPPLHRYMEKAKRHKKFVARFPEAFLGTIVHTWDRDLEVLEAIEAQYGEDGPLSYDPDEQVPASDALREEYNPMRGKVLEWILDNDYLDILGDGGTDLQAHGEPNSGKTTLGLSLAMWRMQANNETVLWADTLNDSGVNDRTEWLAMAPWTTLALPKGYDVRVRVVPKNPSVAPFEVGVEDICRDVIRYASPRDLNQQLMPGQFYVVYPDPQLRGCENVSQFAYHNETDVTAPGEDGPTSRTPIDHWWFAYFAARVSHDDYVHFTTISLDEAGNVLDPDAEKGVHDTYDKIRWLVRKFADARKKGLTLDTFTHALSELNVKYRKKQRFWCTMNGASPPIGKSLPGEKKCPMSSDWTSEMDVGEGQIWTTQNYCSIAWPNLKREGRIDAQISIEFPAVGGVA